MPRHHHLYKYSNPLPHQFIKSTAMENPNGTIIFSTVGRTHYGFDVFSLNIASSVERRLTDGISVNFNAQFVGDKDDIVFVSERTGSARIYRTGNRDFELQLLPGAPGSLFHDRPVVTNNRLFFISAHEKPDRYFKNWSAVYAVELDGEEREIKRVTPPEIADFSPAISQSSEFLAVASYGSRSWDGEFHEINTSITVFKACEPEKRVMICERGGWPTWSGDSTVFFHHQAEDGWWSIFRVDLPKNLKECSDYPVKPIRVTPSGLHCFTPAAFHDGKRIAVATRRPGVTHRHIEIFDIEHKTFQPVTKPLNPNFHHYSPFVSPNSEFIGYHRFRGKSTQCESIVPNIESIISPIKPLRMIRVNGSFPSSSPDGDFIALNSDFDVNGGIKVAKSDGSKRWTLIKDRTAFYNSWSPTERHVIYASLGPIFRPAGTAVQIARIKFEPSDLAADKEELPCDVKILTLEDTGNNAFPSCSPDGKSIVFRSGRSGHKNLYILDAVNGEFNGNGIRQLTDGPWIDTMPCWSPKGDLIGFSSNRHNPANTAAFGAYVVNPDGSGLRRIQIAGPEGSEEAARERINHVSFNKDGDWLVFAANLSGITAEPVAMPNQFQPYGDLYVVKVDGTGLRRLTWNGYEDGTPTWHSVDDLDMSRLSLNGQDGDKLEGQFDEPLWISCDI